ncbi:MAG: hypothetical protein M0006_00515 [Magnetospirillum sp.]|nr:hypothetical protein [Magnetospirillum sp.]
MADVGNDHPAFPGHFPDQPAFHVEAVGRGRLTPGEQGSAADGVHILAGGQFGGDIEVDADQGLNRLVVHSASRLARRRRDEGGETPVRGTPPAAVGDIGQGQPEAVIVVERHEKSHGVEGGVKVVGDFGESDSTTFRQSQADWDRHTHGDPPIQEETEIFPVPKQKLTTF